MLTCQSLGASSQEKPSNAKTNESTQAPGPKDFGKHLITLNTDKGIEARVYLRSKGADWPFNKIFSVLVKFTDVDTQLLDLDIRMPEHDHGMVVKPKVKRVSPGVFAVNGLKLHMRGKWSISLELKTKHGLAQVKPVDFSI